MWAGGITLAGAWLFTDTIRTHLPRESSPNKLRFSHFGTYHDFLTWSELIRAFEGRHPNISIKQEYVAGWYGLYDRKLRQQFLAGSEPHLALVQGISFLAMANQFAELPNQEQDPKCPLEPEKQDPLAVRMYQLQGIQKAMPVTGGNLLIYYNKKSFQRASTSRGDHVALPADDWTMDDFASTGLSLTCDFDGDGNLDQFGFWQPRWVYFLPFLWSFGANVLDPAGEHWLLSDEAATAAFDFYKNMRVGPHRYAPHPHEISQLIQDVAFLTGRTAMCINGPWFIPLVNESELRNDYGVAHIPVCNGERRTRVTWDGIAASKHLPAEELRNALKFIAFVGSPEGQRILTRSARALPARISERDWFIRTHPGEAPRRFVEALLYSQLEPQTNRFREIDRAIGRHLSAFLKPGNVSHASDFLLLLRDDPAIAQFTERLEDSSVPAN